jgi:hypothetical protein
LDRFAPRPATTAERLHFAEWAARLEAAEAVQHVPFAPDLPDALAAYRHFLYGHGTDRTFSYERYVANDPSGRVTLSNAILDAQRGAESLFAAHFAGLATVSFQMTSSAIPVGASASFPYPQTQNWQKAIGAHMIWLSADVTVASGVPPAIPRFRMTLTLHAEDRYNFNPGAKDIATGIPDSDNGVFEITGLAKQYMNYSTLQRQVEWSGISTPALIVPSTVGRQRQPSDNLRVRNRL